MQVRPDVAKTLPKSSQETYARLTHSVPGIAHTAIFPDSPMPSIIIRIAGQDPVVSVLWYTIIAEVVQRVLAGRASRASSRVA